MYQVALGAKTVEYKKRVDAIDAAKEFSKDNQQTVLVKDAQERERLSYYNGELENYTYDLDTKLDESLKELWSYYEKWK